MGLFNFASKIGNKLFGDDEDAGAAIEKHISDDNPGVDDVKIVVEDGVANIKGTAKDKSAYEKAVLMAGNIFGISAVQAEELKLETGDVDEETLPVFYTIQKGDTLWAIASSHLGKRIALPGNI